MTELLSDFLARREGARRALEMADKIERTINDWPEEFRASLMNVAACHRMGAEIETNPPPFISMSKEPLSMADQLRNILEAFPKSGA